MMDRRGVLGLPMRLAVAMVIVSVCVPSLVYATETFKADSDVSEAASEVEKMVSAADSVYYSGYGSTCTIYVSIPAGCEIIIGGEDQDAYTMRVTYDGDVKKTVYTQRPMIQFLGGPVTVTGSPELRFECVSEGGIYGVKVTYV